MTGEHLPQFSYTKKDFKLDWYSGTGAGGQHRNKHQNCLRLTHLPSGITVTAQSSRERPSNLRSAFASLKPKLTEWIKAQLGEREFPKSDEVVRTYHEPDNRILDHASGETVAWSEFDKKFPDLVNARLRSVSEDPSTKKKSGRAS